MTFNPSTKLVVPSGITSHVSRSHIDICDYSVVRGGSYINPNMLFHAAAFKTKLTAPKFVTITIHFSEGSSGSWWYWFIKWNTSFILYSGSNSFLVCPLQPQPWIPSWWPEISEVLSIVPAQVLPLEWLLSLVTEAQTHWNLSLSSIKIQLSMFFYFWLL